MFGKKYDIVSTDEMPSAFTAGCGRAARLEEIDELVEQFGNKRITNYEDAFISGYLAGMQFSSVPSGAEVFGLNATDYEENAFKWYIQDKMKDELRAVSDIINEIIGDDDDE